MPQVLDYSAGFPGAAAIVNAGYVGAVRYIGFPERRKCTTAAELAELARAGLGMALVYEDTAGDWRSGFERGRQAGTRARRHADAIGFPADRPIYMAIDQDVVTDAELRSMVAYLDGATRSLGGAALTGVYGEFDVCARAHVAGVAEWFWQCRAWSGTPVRLFAARHLFQRVGTVTVDGIPCDINDVLSADYGQYPRGGAMSWSESLTFEAPGSRFRAPGTPPYHETHTASEALGDTMFYAADGMRAAQRVEVQLAAMNGSLERHEAALLAALREALSADVDEDRLASALGPILAPLIDAGATPGQVEAAMRRVFASAGLVTDPNQSKE